MRKSSFLLSAIALFTLSLFTFATAGNMTAKAGNKRLLLVTDSGGFIHDSVGVAEERTEGTRPEERLRRDLLALHRANPTPRCWPNTATKFRKRPA